MIFKSIPLMFLSASGQPRPLVTEDVDKLAVSMKSIGLISPITVQQFGTDESLMKPSYKIVAGHHRVAAARSLGWTEIDAVISQNSGLEAELIEIDENLCRSELTKAQRTKYTARRKQIWEALHPEPKRTPVADLPDDSNTTPGAVLDDGELEVAQVAPPQVSTHGGARPQTQGFASATAEATGQSKATTNRALARADALGDAVLDKITGTSLDSGTQMDALAKLAAPERAALIERAAAGEQVSARQSFHAKSADTVKADKPEDADKSLKERQKQAAAEIGKEFRLAAFDALALANPVIDDVATLLRAWFLRQVPLDGSGGLAACFKQKLRYDAGKTPCELVEINKTALRLHIQAVDQATLWAAVALWMVLDDRRYYDGCPEPTLLSALATDMGVDLEPIRKSTIAQVRAKYALDLAKDKAPSVKRKKTTAEVQVELALALQAQDDSAGVDADADIPVSAPVMGTPITPTELAVDVRVKVTSNTSGLSILMHKWAGKTGVITQKLGDRAWMVAFRGRNGGLKSFDASELTILPVRAGDTAMEES